MEYLCIFFSSSCAFTFPFQYYRHAKRYKLTSSMLKLHNTPTHEAWLQIHVRHCRRQVEMGCTAESTQHYSSAPSGDCEMTLTGRARRESPFQSNGERQRFLIRTQAASTRATQGQCLKQGPPRPQNGLEKKPIGPAVTFAVLAARRKSGECGSALRKSLLLSLCLSKHKSAEYFGRSD